MISRSVLALDRVATFLLSAVLIAAGLLAVWWWTGSSPLPATTSTAPAADLVATSWWPWASAVAGLVLIYLGLRWLLAHLSRRSVPELRLKKSGATGTLLVKAGTVVDAGAERFSEALGVRSAKGTMIRDRGQLVATITAVIEPHADLADLAEQADRVAAELAQVLDRDDLRCRVELRVARRSASTSRS